MLKSLLSFVFLLTVHFMAAGQKQITLEDIYKTYTFSDDKTKILPESEGKPICRYSTNSTVCTKMTNFIYEKL